LKFVSYLYLSWYRRETRAWKKLQSLFCDKLENICSKNLTPNQRKCIRKSFYIFYLILLKQTSFPPNETTHILFELHRLAILQTTAKSNCLFYYILPLLVKLGCIVCMLEIKSSLCIQLFECKHYSRKKEKKIN
jgi:hypothetical protein